MRFCYRHLVLSFPLLSYRVTDHINLPFRVIPIIEEQGKTSVTVNVKVGMPPPPPFTVPGITQPLSCSIPRFLQILALSCLPVPSPCVSRYAHLNLT